MANAQDIVRLLEQWQGATSKLDNAKKEMEILEREIDKTVLLVAKGIVKSGQSVDRQMAIELGGGKVAVVLYMDDDIVVRIVNLFKFEEATSGPSI